MKRFLILISLLLCTLLTGCAWLDGSYVSVEQHQMPHQQTQTDVITAQNYLDLMEAMQTLIASGTETAVISVADYPASSVDSGMAVAIRYATSDYPLGAYSVESITYEHGTSGGQPALALTIAYRHTLTEILQIRQVESIAAAEKEVTTALDSFAAGVVLYVEDYSAKDFTQLVQSYALENPQLVMETPQVTEEVYGTGAARVVELVFTYQNSRDSLRQMKTQVTPVFDSASLYVSGDGADRQKYSQLFAFLMERFDYTIETSITPAYSLLRHGVGDSRAFAMVYAAMCRSAGLECTIVTGTRSGEPRSWNMVLDNGHYYHVDLLRSSQQGIYREFTDGEMQGYVWDYSAYPACTGAAVEETEEIADKPEETEETTVETQEALLPEEPENNMEVFEKRA